MDRNGAIQILSDRGLFRTHDSQFLYPGELVTDRTYRPLTDKNTLNIAIVNSHFVYQDDITVLNKVRAGKLFIIHI